MVAIRGKADIGKAVLNKRVSSSRGLATSLALAPHDASVAKPKMRAAFLLSPDRRTKSGGAIVMMRDMPARALVGEKIHM